MNNEGHEQNKSTNGWMIVPLIRSLCVERDVLVSVRALSRQLCQYLLMHLHVRVRVCALRGRRYPTETGLLTFWADLFHLPPVPRLSRHHSEGLGISDRPVRHHCIPDAGLTQRRCSLGD